MFAVPADTVALPADRAAAHPVRIALEHARDRSAWAPLLRYDPEQRFAALVERTDDFEVWLLSWLPGQQTGLHDHGGAEGAFTVVTGHLTEFVATAPGERGGSAAVVSHRVGVGQSRVFGPRYVHRVRNAGQDPAVSIHVYRPARAEMSAYEFDPVTGPRRTGAARVPGR